ncbi:hypothetical protein PMAYCL1PPCAC_00254, partial [Pristionchus mayeri]
IAIILRLFRSRLHVAARSMNIPADNSSNANNRPFLLEESLPTKDPFKLFDVWKKQVTDVLPFEEANGVSFSTVSEDGRPSCRMVLLKSYDEDGFVFNTNYTSRKGTQLSGNPNAAMLFYWPRFHRQIRVEGVVDRLAEDAAIAHWNSRPVSSRIAGIASAQSTVIPDRQYLEHRQRELEQEVTTQGEVAAAKPPTWGALILRPRYFEFWQGQTNRLHDRICFSTERPDTDSADFVRPSDRPGWHMFRLAS